MQQLESTQANRNMAVLVAESADGAGAQPLGAVVGCGIGVLKLHHKLASFFLMLQFAPERLRKPDPIARRLHNQVKSQVTGMASDIYAMNIK